MSDQSHDRTLQIMLPDSATFDSVVNMDHVTIIRDLGGAKALADEMTRRGVHVQPVTVRSWSLKGRMIPAKYWSHIATIAKDRQIDVSFEALAQAAAA